MREVIKAMTNSGIKTVDYATGYTRRLDTAVRQNILWGVKECNQNTADRIGQEFGADGYEISYHSNPRPSHADMGGGQYAIGKARTINGVYYPSFSDVEDLLEDFGCLHFKFPILLGISSPAYSKAQLEEFKANDNKVFEFEGKKYTGYEATQMQRKLETAIRNERDLLKTAKAFGNNELINEAKTKISLLTSKYAQFSKASGLSTKMERTRLGVKTSDDISKLAKLADDWEYAKPTKHSKEELTELIKYAKSKGVQIHNKNAFDGDIGLLKEQIDIVAQMHNEYGIIRKVTIEFRDMTDGDYAGTVNNTIIFNRKVLRNREVTNINLKRDNILSSNNTNGIAAHEMGHIIANQYGLKGIDIGEMTYYNVYGRCCSKVELIEYIENNISQYSVDINPEFDDKPFESKYYKEIIPEILAKNITEANIFTKEFVKIMKGGIAK